METAVQLGNLIQVVHSFLCRGDLQSRPTSPVLLFSLNAPFALGLGFVVLKETVRPLQLLGVLLVLVGIAMAILFGAVPASRPRGENEAIDPAPQLALGLGLLSGVASALFQAAANLVARPVMSGGVNAIAAMSLRAAFATACFAFVSLLPLSILKDRQAFSLRLFAISAVGAAIATGLGMSLLWRHWPAARSESYRRYLLWRQSSFCPWYG